MNKLKISWSRIILGLLTGIVAAAFFLRFFRWLIGLLLLYALSWESWAQESRFIFLAHVAVGVLIAVTAGYVSAWISGERKLLVSGLTGLAVNLLAYSGQAFGKLTVYLEPKVFWTLPFFIFGGYLATFGRANQASQKEHQ